MKRKLISYDVFESIQSNSLSASEKELNDAAKLVATSLGTDQLNVKCFGKENVVYETAHGEYVHATYRFTDKHLVLENIEQLVVDETTEKTEQKRLLTDMLESLAGNEDKKAEELFQTYINMPATKRSFSLTESKQAVKARKSHKAVPGRKLKGSKKMFKEAAVLCENIFNYLNYRELVPSMRGTETKTDAKGEVVALRVPKTQVRNEAKMLHFTIDGLKTDAIVKRSSAKKIAENSNFCHAVAELKRHNAVSDNTALEETLEKIVTAFPQVLYLTQTELSSAIREALDSVSVVNYDDQTCDFMAEGILRMAHKAHEERANKLTHLAGENPVEDGSDKYEHWQNVMAKFYASLDETTHLEMQAFADLYESLRHLHEVAKQDNRQLAVEIAEHLDCLLPVLQQQEEPSMEVASKAANFLWSIVETNLETGDWNISNGTHRTINGDHPQMAKNAKQGYAPSSDFSGDWGDPAPVSDGKSYKGGLAGEMRDNGFGNYGNDCYPSLSNPVVPTASDSWFIKGEKHIDNDSDQLGHSGGGDTWPGLQNPYVPSSVKPKMKSDNLVVEK